MQESFENWELRRNFFLKRWATTHLTTESLAIVRVIIKDFFFWAFPLDFIVIKILVFPSLWE